MKWLRREVRGGTGRRETRTVPTLRPCATRIGMLLGRIGDDLRNPRYTLGKRGLRYRIPGPEDA